MSAPERANGRPEGFDVSDWLDAGGTADELLRLSHEATEHARPEPTATPTERRSELVVGLATGLTIGDLPPANPHAAVLAFRSAA